MKKIIRILNIVYMAIAAAAIVVYFTVPFINVEATVTLNKTEITTLINSVPGAEEIKESDIFFDSDGPVNAPLSLNITPQNAFKALSPDSQNVIKSILVQPNVDDIIDSIMPYVNRAVLIVIKNGAKDAITTTLEETGQTGKVTEEQIDNATDAVINALTKENSTVESVAETIYDEVEQIVTQAGGDMGDVTLEDIEDKLYEILDEYGAIDEAGNIYNNEDIAAALLYDLINNGDIFNIISGGIGTQDEGSTSSVPPSSSSSSSSETPSSKLMSLNASSNQNDELTTKEKSEQLTNLLTAKINEYLVGEFVPISSGVMIGMMIALIVFIATWGFLFFYTLSRTFRHRKCFTFTGPVFWIVGIIQAVLGIGIVVSGNFSGQIFSMIGATISKPGTLLTVFEKVTYSASASALIPGILVLVCVPLTIVYTVFKRKLKKQNRIDEAVDKKIAQMQNK